MSVKPVRMIVKVGSGKMTTNDADGREIQTPDMPTIIIDDGSGPQNKLRLALDAMANIEANKERVVLWLIDGNYHLDLANWLGVVGNIPTKRIGEYMDNCRMLHLAFLSYILGTGNDTGDQILGYKNCIGTIGLSAEMLVVGKNRGPAFIICSGPSFAMFAGEYGAKSLCEKGLVVACDSALDSCLSIGLVPDMVVSIERYDEIARLFSRDRYDVPLLSCPLQCREIYDKFDRVVFMGNKQRYVEEVYPQLASNLLGPSCSTAAIAVLSSVGYGPIYLIGSDNAFHGDVHHGTVTPLDTTPGKEHGRMVVDGKLTIAPWLKIRDWIDAYYSVKYLSYPGVGLGYRKNEAVSWQQIMDLSDVSMVDIETKKIRPSVSVIAEIKEETKKMLQKLQKSGPSAIFDDGTKPRSRAKEIVIGLLSPSASAWYSVRSQSISDEHIERVDREWKNELVQQIQELHEISSR